VSVVDSPTALPTYRGWMIDWITRLTTQYMTMTASIRPGPPSSRATTAGGIRPITKPMLGMKFVTKASTPQTKAPGTPITAEQVRVDDGDDQPEDRRDTEVAAGALRE
jgi:hypothetical protein